MRNFFSSRFLSALLFLVIGFHLTSAHAELIRHAEVVRGEAKRVSVAGLGHGSTNYFVTAIRNATDNLQIMVWRMTSTGNLSLRGNVTTEGTVKEVDVTSAPIDNQFREISERRFVTAVRDSEDRLRIMLWEISSDGRSITRRDTATGPKVREVKANIVHDFSSGTIGRGVLVAAVQSNGNLMVGRVDVDHQVGKLVNEGADTFGQASRLATGDFAYAAFRDSDNNLRFTAFTDKDDTGWARDMTIARGGISATAIDTGRAGVMSFSSSEGPFAVKQGLLCNQRLLLGYGSAKLIRYSRLYGGSNPAEPPGQFREARQLSGHEAIAKFTAVLTSRKQGLTITVHAGFETWCKALKSDRGKPVLRVWQWRTTDSGTAVIDKASLSGDYLAVDISKVNEDGQAEHPYQFAMAARDQNGNLRVSIWSATD